MFIKTLSDEELIALFSHGVSIAWETFYERYYKHASSLAKLGVQTYRGYYITYKEFKDLALNLIVVALDKYTPNSMSFYSYWKTITLMEYQHLAFDNNSFTFPSMKTISLDEKVSDNISLDEVIGLNDDSIERNVNQKEIENIILSKIEKLDENERKIFIWLAMDIKPKQIMEKLNITKRQYYRYKNKIKEIVDIEIFNNYFK